jgi:3-oxoacyl-[acyl-carrier-protein] synthase-1
MLHIRTLPPRSQGVERMVPVVRALLSPLLGRLAAFERPRLLVVLSVAERFAEGGSCVKQVPTLAAAIAQEAKAAGVEAAVEIVPRGHAGLAFALPAVCSALASGRTDFAIVGGVDTSYDAEVIDQLVRERRLYDGKNLEGFIPGEGGAFLLLARADVARRAGFAAQAFIEGAAAAEEPAAIDLDLPITASALTRVLRTLCDPLEASKRPVDYWLSDLTHEPDRVREWMLAFPRATAGASGPEAAVELLSPLFGDLGAATVPTGLVVAAEAFLRGDPPARTCLVCASSTGPTRGAVLLTKRS